MKKLLIYVPTFEASDRLSFFLERFISESFGLEDEVDLHLSDNCSSSFNPLVSAPNISYSINASNIGLAKNFNKVFTINKDYEYTWIVGDDDFFVNGSIGRVLNILKESKPVFLFLNTVAYPVLLKDEVIAGFVNTNTLPVDNSVIKSKLSVDGVICEKFANLINSKVDDVLLGSVMCGVFLTSAVKDYSSINFDDSTDLNVFSSYPHVINYARSISPDAFSIFDPFVHTFNFWNGGNTWRNQYDVVVGLGLLYSIKTYYENSHLTPEQESGLIRHYFLIGGISLGRLNKNTEENILSQVSVVMPYLIDAITRLKLLA